MSVDNTHSESGDFSNGAQASAAVETGPVADRRESKLGRAAGYGRRQVADFAQDQRGGITIFLLVLFIMLLVVGGMAVDYQRHEAARADLQDALDRGSLAAANLNQGYALNGTKTMDEQAWDVISEFMASRNYLYDNFTLATKVQQVAGGREVTAIAKAEINTIFLSLVGIDTLKVNATSKATHAAKWLEIMLVLDITGSMESTSQSGRKKIEDLKIAAKNFIDLAFAEGDPDHMTISILPFSQNVNLPRPVADLFNINRHHDYASCIDYSEFDFTTTAFPFDKGTAYKQTQHFDSDVGGGVDRFGCPKTNNAATLHSNDQTALKNAIDAMTPETWTAMHVGTNWAAAMLDPASAGIVDYLIAQGTLDASFDDVPRAWDDSSVRKIVVLMSDGKNTRINRVYDTAYASHPVTWWNANQVPGGDRENVVNNNNKTGVDVNGDGLNDGIGDVRLEEICTTIKTQPSAAIYTIGFEIAGNQVAESALENCASSPSTYYLVEGVDLTTAFENIWNDIYNLKLMN